jgi:hypothetical protein
MHVSTTTVAETISYPLATSPAEIISKVTRGH